MRTIFAILLLAAGQAPLHEAQYPDADIAYGAKLYNEKCVTCHGPQGDAIGGVNLRSGRFRNAVIDRDLERFIRAGSTARRSRPATPRAAAPSSTARVRASRAIASEASDRTSRRI